MYISRLFTSAIVASALFGIAAAPATANQTTYTYDARGRLVKVERTSGANNGARTDYQHDRANNRTRVTTTGAPR